MVLFGKKQLKELKSEIESSLNNVKDQFQQHLDSINDNTNEIQANYEYLCQLDNKIEKLAQRLDQIHLFLKQLTNNDNFVPDIEDNYQVQPLTVKEREVFLVMYAVAGNKLLSYKNIADKINLTESLVQQYITNLIEKGVPIIKEYRMGKPYLKLDPKFVELQAKNNILNIDEELIKKVFSRP
jgi:predicted transcriptional regulator